MTLGTQPIVSLISFSVLPALPITKPGFSASIHASLKVVSNFISVMPASSGTIFLIFSAAFSASINIAGSGLMTTLLRMTLTKFFTTSPLDNRTEGFFE